MGRVAVAPSLAESLPYVVMEAAAAQLPVISTKVGGIAEIFGPTADQLIAPDDAAALAAAMGAALTNPGSTERQMRRRLDHVRSEFSVAHMVDAIEALYRQAG